MDYVEAEGNTIDEAIDRALAELGVDRDRAEIEILCDTSRGLFGIGGRKARVRASLRREIEFAELEAEAANAPPTTPAPHVRPATPKNTAEASPSAPAIAADAKLAASLDPGIERAREVLEQIIGLMDVTAQVTAVNAEDLAVRGDTRGVLIGRQGQTLDALEYLLNRIIAREEQGSRVTIDVEDYRQRRRQSLEALAGRLADRVRRRGKPVSLNPMSPRDRRIVHLALQNDASLVTRSTGDGYYRRLVIAPAESRGGRRPRGERKPASGPNRPA